MKILPAQMKRLLSNIKYAENGCWEWTGDVVSKINSPQPRFRFTINWQSFDGSARRILYTSFFGRVSKHKKIGMTCGNPLCVFPGHMQCGTQGCQRTYNPKRKKCLRDIKLIKRIIGASLRGETASSISKKLGVCYPTVLNVIKMASYCKSGALSNENNRSNKS